jgi:O-antigen ligase
MQTRGGLAGIIIFILFYIFFVREIFLIKLKKLILILLIPILFYEIFMNSIFEINFYKEIKIENDLKLEKSNRKNKIEKDLKFEKSNRFYVKDDGFLIHSSGRSDLWKIGINEIKKSAIIFGYGPQGDRQIFDKLKNDNNLENSRAIKWSTNISNSLLYTYLSGGVFGLVLIMSIYILIIKEVIFAIFFNGVFKKNSKTEIVSIFCLIYLCFRSLYENGFAVFSTDYILLVINFFNLYKFNLNSKVKSFKK